MKLEMLVSLHSFLFLDNVKLNADCCFDHQNNFVSKTYHTCGPQNVHLCIAISILKNLKAVVISIGPTVQPVKTTAVIRIKRILNDIRLFFSSLLIFLFDSPSPESGDFGHLQRRYVENN